MKETDIRKYAELMKELGLTGLEITEDNQVVRLERTAAPEVRQAVPVAVPAAPAPYAAPAENADPYVSVGDKVKKGQTLCIVEAMKLMNEISAEEDGVVTEICVANGQMVEYGTELFRIQR